jgi:hypothetical protein
MKSGNRLSLMLSLAFSAGTCAALISFAAADATSRPSTAPAAGVEAVFWEHQSWKPGGSSARLTLWADGRSEITLKSYGQPQATKPGWTSESQPPYALYHKSGPLSPDDAQKRFSAALSAGIEFLKTFPAGYKDGSGTSVGVQRNGKWKQVVVPLFVHPDEPDNKGSENEKRYLAVQRAIGNFDTDAVDQHSS